MRPPFHILTFWHSDDEAKVAPYVTQVVRQMMRNPQAPYGTTPGIPVFTYHGPQPRPEWRERIGEAQEGLVFMFFHNSLTIDEAWHDFLQELIQLKNEVSGWHWVPLAFNKNALRNPVISQSNTHVERLYDAKESLSHAIRLAVTLEVGKSLYPAPSAHTKALELFISLSHGDDQGDTLAGKIAGHLPKLAEIATFYDVADTRPGESFVERIKNSLQQAFVLVLRTDSYGSREFCRREVLMAKQYQRPVIVLNALKKGESRSFPYLGNGVQLHHHPENQFTDDELSQLIADILMEAVRHEYQRRWLSYWCDQLQYPGEVVILPSPPELLGLAQKGYGSEKATILYPEPPLGEQEVSLLNNLLGSRKISTPSQLSLPSLSANGLKGKKIALSVSEPTGAYMPGQSWHHVYDALMELARYLLIQGATLIYGGYLGYQKEKDVNVMQLLVNLVRGSQSQLPDPQQPAIVNWLPAFMPANTELKAQHLGEVDFQNQAYPAWAHHLPEDDDLRKVGALFEMRRNLANTADVQIVLGGKPEGFMGVYPGVLEEVWRFAQTGKPTYLLGGFGGVTQALTQGLQGDTLRDTSGTAPRFMVQEELRAQAQKHGEDLPALSVVLHQIQANPGLHTGLTQAEAQTLIASQSLPEIIRLVLKGLNKPK